MKCPQCQTDNPDTRNFCRECGNRLLLVCPQCNYENLPGDKFCGGCGHDLRKPKEAQPKDLSFDEKLTKIQRYLPKGLTEKILSQRDRIEGERKQVTVMFCDLEGFTQLAERLGPEGAYTIMDQVYEILIHKVHDYEGTVNEMTGDGIMAIFGAPIALEDAPQRAIRSAYAIHRAMAKFSDKIKQERSNISSLKMRIGIHTGPVVVGTLGNDLRVEFKAVGDTVNLASRMEGLAEPGSTYVTEDTFRLTEGLFRYEALGEYAIKGKEGMVKAYRVIAPSTRRTRFDVSAEKGLTPFIGRERELEILLDGFERAKTGRGQAISIMAEAGVGKSRLLYEFRKAVANEDVTFMEGKCLSYSRGIAYHPVIDIVKSNFNIMEGDGDSEIKEKVKRGLNLLGFDEASILPYILELLSVKDSGIDTRSMSPEARKERIIEALNRNALKSSEINPLIIAVEDLHWIDKSSEDRLISLLNTISGARIFLIFTHRPEYVHSWGAKSYHSQIVLNRLSNRESLSMLAYLLGTKDIDRDLEELILEKTEGVPFFIEELIKSLQNLKIIKKKNETYHLAKEIHEVSIPSTIEDVIMARVDTLPEGAKEVLQIGSVIEREFNFELLKKVSDLSERELLIQLSVLKDAELLYERGIYPENAFIFKHAMTHDVAYNSLLSSKRKAIHAKVGKVIEGLYSTRLAEYYEIVSRHFERGEVWEKAAGYLLKAAEKAKANYAYRSAITLCRRVLEAAGKRKNMVEEQIRGFVLAGDLASLLGELDQANQNYDLAIELSTDSVIRRNIQNKRHLPRLIVRDGAKIVFYEHGGGEETLLVVNPVLYGLSTFQPVLERLCQEFRIITIDPRGTGGSDPIPKGYSLKDHVEDVRAVIEAAECGAINGVGISRGGNLLIKLAAAYPGLVKRLVLCGAGTDDLTPGSLYPLRGEWTKEFIEALKNKNLEQALTIFSSILISEPGTHELAEQFIKRTMNLPQETIVSFFVRDPEANIVSLLPKVTIPTVVMQGTADLLFPFEGGRFIWEQIPDALFYAFKGRGHAFFLTAPGEFCEVSRQFVLTETIPSQAAI
ncbi:MAG: alpha/beta fold hydrolase [Desulfobacteraceae bacterium]|nr:MAG: alpha/beta fold hydrolase [Desulfobacteraceae bacterium]